MRHPFWIVNSALLISFCLFILFIFFVRPSTPKIASILPNVDIKTPQKETFKIDPSKIYLNDLFNTYKMPAQPVEQKHQPRPMPAPPKPRAVQAPIKKPPKFLDPLNINLKGIMIGAKEEHNRAIIENIPDKTSKNYKIGNRIEDARLIRILRNKVILLRSNGQQETIYLYPHDAELEAIFLPTGDWSQIIRTISPQEYEVDPKGFIERVPNLAQLIELLDLTTVYKQGSSVGSRIGKIKNNSLGSALGLKQGDVITSINGQPVKTTQERLAIYKSILAMQEKDCIILDLIRQQQTEKFLYRLKNFSSEHDLLSTTTQKQIDNEDAKAYQELMSHLQTQQEKYNYITQKLETKEKENMVKLNNHPFAARSKKARNSMMKNFNV